MPLLAKFGLGLLIALTLGCSACNDPGSSRVPYQRPEGEPSPPEQEGPTPEATAWEPSRGRSLAPGTRRTTIDGISFSAEDRELRAVLSVDTDGDQARDLLALARDADGSVTLLFSRRRGDTFASLRTIRQSLAPRACTLTGAALTTLSPTIAFAQFGWACPDLSDGETIPKPPRHVVWLLRLGLHPRLGEEIIIPEQASGASALRLEVGATPPTAINQTGTPVQIMAEVGPPGRQTRLALRWHDRVSGLVLDREALAESFTQRARRARRSLARDPARAYREAGAGAELIDALCRGHDPLIRVAGVSGLPCSAEPAFTSLVATRIAAQIGDGDLIGALRSELEYRLDDRATSDDMTTLLEAAWDGASGSAGYRWRAIGQPHGLTPNRSPHRTRLTFLDEGTLLVQGPTRQVLSLSHPTPALQDDGAGLSATRMWISSPANSDIVVHRIVRTCAGFRVVIGSAQSPPLPNIGPDQSHMPLLQARAPLDVAPCVSDPGSSRPDDGGWTILGWAVQGLVAARLDELRLIPVDGDGQPGGAASPISRGGAWLGAMDGAIQAGGLSHVYATSRGIISHRLQSSSSTELIRPPADTGVALPVFDPAIAPSGRRIAVLGSTRVWVVESEDAPPFDTTPNLMPSDSTGR